MQTHAIMNRDLSLIILGVASSLGQIGCVVLPYTRLTRASVSPQGARTPPGPSGQANLATFGGQRNPIVSCAS